MPTDAPNALVSLSNEPLMAKMLGVKVMDFETSMMNVPRLVLRQEQRVMIYRLAAAIHVHKDTNVLPTKPTGSSTCVVAFVRYVKEVCWCKIEVRGVPRE
jgi:hypothetical protein